MRRLVILAATIAAAPLHGQGPADLIVINARIYTADATRPMVQALAVRGGRIVFAGNRAGAEALAGPATARLDLGGKTVIPGMVDAHVHLLGLGQALRIVDLTGTTSYDEVVARAAARAKAAKPGEWIRGRGWDQNDWAVTEFPTHEALSRAVPDHPVYLTRVDGHAHAGPVYCYKEPVFKELEYAGSHIVRAARIEPITPPGQVYASQQFSALASTQRVHSFTCEYVGRIPLPKHAGSVPLYLVRRANP